MCIRDREHKVQQDRKEILEQQELQVQQVHRVKLELQVQ